MVVSNYNKVMQELLELNNDRHYFRFSTYALWSMRIKCKRNHLEQHYKLNNEKLPSNAFNIVTFKCKFCP